MTTVSSCNEAFDVLMVEIMGKQPLDVKGKAIMKDEKQELRKKTYFHLMLSTQFKKLLQVLGIRAEESKMDVLVLTERETLKFLAQDMSFG
ncbi:hypothetical protein Tco_0892975 [Tanacetum coccineum]|uniref:Reverse transcriptase n=1 Tax=Tanacetum coccineum TaxID=301880 RepID=A0ABQ5CAK5_9ASTR